jgi:hypothetical protein
MYIFPSTQEYIVEQAEEVIKVETVDALEARIKSAQEGAQASTTAKAQAAYDAAYEQSMNEVKLKVIKEYRAEVEAKEKDLSKKVGEY